METLQLTSDGKLFFNLPHKLYKPHRMIGEVKARTLTVKRDPIKHLFRKFNAYGFSYDVMKQGSQYFDKVEVNTGFETLQTTRNFVLKHGKYLHFKRNDLERQIFLPLDEFGKSDIQERKELPQPSLFENQ
jgi:hypothetical protein